MGETRVAKKISLAEFMKHPLPDGADKLLSKMNGGSFMECHMKVFAEYGIWVEELTPVFQKFDAMVAFRPLPAAVR
jgi:hypothetical protein